MSLAGVDLVFAGFTIGLILLVKSLAVKLPDTILIKGQANQTVFSLAKEKINWLIVGLGFYVWLMEFIIVNELLLLRLVTPILLEASLFALFVVTSLGHRKLGERLTITGAILFVVSVIYLAI